jgi:hypothetical protein
VCLDDQALAGNPGHVRLSAGPTDGVPSWHKRLKANKLLQPQMSAMQEREFELARAEAWLSEVKGVVSEKLLKVVDDLKKNMKK